MQIVVKRINDIFSLAFMVGDEVLDEFILEADVARSLRSALEAVISGRRQSCTASTLKEGLRLPPEEFPDRRFPRQPND